MTACHIQIINGTLEEADAKAGIPVADVENAFAIDDWDTLAPLAGHGMVPRNQHDGEGASIDAPDLGPGSIRLRSLA